MKRDFKAYQRRRENIDTFIEKVNSLDLKPDDWDAVSFFEIDNLGQYRYVFIKFLPQEGQDVVDYVQNESGLGQVYHMLGDDGHGNLTLEDVVLGDPMHILLNNLVRSGTSGYLIKKCTQGTKMANDIFEEAKKSLIILRRRIENTDASTVV